ncbi:YbaN family protein [Methanorbis rubei]|uniref:DUF454 domain-containing protein n=1 Tax=Methanorbis rubei TaxID=3028300 RepID=A0AAE4MF77_9EURY|nr:hypothetical protein [Methanocorpusculaceae archaeon Cs1]
MTFKQQCLKLAGIILLVIGAVGIVVPVLPTTPFVILAAACFSLSSPEIAAWLEKNRYFGPYIEHYRNKTGVPLRQKITALIFLWVMLCISMIIVQKSFVIVILCVVGVLVTLHLVLMKTRQN